MEIAPNEYGLTNYHCWSDCGPTLREVLTKNSVSYQETEIPHLVGFAGNAELIFYVSPKLGKPVTVLAIPHRYDIDGFAEEYFYFVGMTKEQALQDEQWWLNLYPKLKALLP